MNKFVISYIIFLFSFSSAVSQDTLMPIILLDDVVISELNDGFSIQDFVNYVKNDTTFYMGFKHLRYYSHDYESELIVFDKNNNQIGSINKWGTHYSDTEKAWIVNDSIIKKGKIFKRNGKSKFYTPKAFDEVFFPNDTINVSLKISKEKNMNESQNLRDAKTIGFSIGSSDTEQNRGGVRSKLSIFNQEMQKYYDYIISDTIYNGRPCYVFTVRLKSDLSDRNKEKTLIRKLVSFFDKKYFNVIFREYKFKYSTWLFNIDMRVVVDMDYINEKHLPVNIYYNGFWNVLFFKPEKAVFLLKNTNYIVE